MNIGRFKRYLEPIRNFISPLTTKTGILPNVINIVIQSRRMNKTRE